MKKLHQLVVLMLCSFSVAVSADRVKDLTDVGGVRSNQLVGYGLVVGLGGTGDGKDLAFTGQSLKSFLSGLGVSVDGPVSEYDLGESLRDLAGQNAKKDMKLENVAAVMVTAELPPFIKPGQRIDVNVSAIGVTSSLRGGNLIMAELKGVDGQIYALAQGPLTVTGVSVNAAGSSVEIGVPTSGRIPNGAIVERMVETPFGASTHVVLNVRDADFSTSNAIANMINETFGWGTAEALDSVSVVLAVPADGRQRVAFMSAVENLDVIPGETTARVIVNSRTGTAVINRSVRVTAAAVSHGAITVRINTVNDVVQPNAFGEGETAEVANAEVAVSEGGAGNMFMFETGVELLDIVDAVNRIGATPSSLIAILEALKRSGSLRAELVVI